MTVGDLEFEPRELCPDAEVPADAEGREVDGLAPDVEAVGIGEGRGIALGARHGA